MTPFHRLVNHHSRGAETSEALLHVHLEQSKGVELEMLNSAGDSVMHTAVMAESPWLTRLLVSFSPKLMYRENAVGRTSVELAYHKHISQVFSAPNNRDPGTQCSGPSAWLNTIREEALPSPPNKYEASVEGVWEICRLKMESHPDKRRLVSLHEANDVARRLGERMSPDHVSTLHTHTNSGSLEYTSSRYFSPSARDHDDGHSDEADSQQERDLIEEWTRTDWESLRWYEFQRNEEKKREARLGGECGECGHRHAEDEDDVDSDFYSDVSDADDVSGDDEDGSDKDEDGSGKDEDGSDKDEEGSDMDEDSD